MSQTSKIILAVVITALVVGGGMYCLQRTSWDEERSEYSQKETPNHEKEMETPQGNYVNNTWGFALEIPTGYEVTGDDNSFSVVKEVGSDEPTSLPEFHVQMSKSASTSIIENADQKIISTEDVTINGVSGKKSIVSYASYPEGSACPIYRLENAGTIYEFSLHECLDSAIYETVVRSFRLLP